MYRILIVIVSIAGVLVGSDSYSVSIRKWQADRDAGLRAPDSWLTLVGLFWLKPGKNTIGTAGDNDFVLPKGSAPGHAGIFRLEGGKLVYIGANGSPRSMSFDEEKPTPVHVGTVSLYAIKREDRFAIRAKDSASPVLKNFQGMKYFPINPQFHFQAKFVPEAKKIPILNILGRTDMEDSPGIVEFTYARHTYHLRPIFEGKTLFFLFKDMTNKTQTYQAGRMLNTPLPVNGKVDLDFNRSYNPPCTFTPYATCPLPPKENILPFPVEAGELRYGTGHVEYTAER
ncbi:MAG: DUF1684 domain-containing protein [Acidobacteriaceae bacterium]|nr:DUF1684 domain-containing protein [Acidobacteriaceae bacterium]